MGFGLDEIKSLADGAIPSKPSIPSLPGLTEFDNFAVGTACIEKSTEHTAKTLELRSKFNTAESMMDVIKAVLGPILGIETDVSFDLPEFPDLNMDLSVGKITAPKLGDLPECLAATITGEAITKGPGLMGDILDPLNSAIGTYNSMTSSANTALNKRLTSFTEDINAGIYEVEKYLAKLMAFLCAPEDKPLFELFEDFEAFIKETNFINVYKDWRDLDACLRKHCQPVTSMLMTDDFMWYDEDHKEFILPIQLNDGKMKVAKFFQNLTPQQKKKAVDIEKRYGEYKNRKREAVRVGEEVARKNKVKEDQNPFAAVGSAMESSRNDLVNTLF